MFQNLSDRLQAVFKNLTGRGKLSEADVDAAMREIRMALLEADVNFKVVKELVAGIRERAIGTEVTESLTPGQSVVKIVLDELVTLMGTTESRLTLSGRTPSVVMLVGLQGSGKTTATAKLANLLRKQGRRPIMVACDVYRPAAIDQLQALGREIDIPVYRGADGDDPADIAAAGVKAAIDGMRDVVIVDTAGRLHVDDDMMDEAVRIRDAVKPDQILMVVDAMTGQDAVNVAKAFADKVDFDGVIMSKLDGDARGGAALSIRKVTGKPIKFASVGEKLDALESFHPDRMAQRILGMGDVVTLIEKAQDSMDADQAAAMEARLRTSGFTLDDFLDQLQQVKKMGGLGDMLKMMPGAGQMKELKDAEIDERQLDRTEAIIRSMTARERVKPSIINGSRRERIANGSGVAVSDVNRLIKQFEQTRKLMKQFQGQQGKKGKRRGGRGMPPGMRMPF
ncbi:MAG: signal recognition particle protein [Actinomycetota bacterium]|jgi:signal recognition particle subunit SRP54|nr:signal recognition particle protein [Actinomycetota bacterium]